MIYASRNCSFTERGAEYLRASLTARSSHHGHKILKAEWSRSFWSQQITRSLSRARLTLSSLCRASSIIVGNVVAIFIPRYLDAPHYSSCRWRHMRYLEFQRVRFRAVPQACRRQESGGVDCRGTIGFADSRWPTGHARGPDDSLRQLASDVHLQGLLALPYPSYRPRKIARPGTLLLGLPLKSTCPDPPPY